MTGLAACPTKDDQLLDMLAQSFKADPFPTYAILRERRVCRVGPGEMWAISRMDDVKFALSRPDIFSSEGYMAMFQPEWLSEDCRRDHFIITQDPPIHTSNRAVVNKAFVKRVIQALIPLMEEAAHSLCQAITPNREIDFTSAFAYPYVGTIIGDITGTGGDRSIGELRRWFELMEILTPQRPTDEVVAAAEEGTRSQMRYYEKVIADRKKTHRGDLTSELVHAKADSIRLTDRELRSCLDLLIGAGLGTTTHTLGNALIQLAKLPALLASLKAEPEKIPAFIEEVLRYDPATHCLLRYTTEKVEIGETTIPARALVLVVLAAANRDPAHFEDPDHFNIQRKNNKEHLAFGSGPHVCIGSALAKLELKIAIETIVDAFDAVKIPEGATLEWINSLPTHGTVRLPLVFIKQ